METNIVDKILNFLKDYGLPGLLFLIILILVFFPEKAEKLKTIFLTPIFKYLKIGKKQYISSKISSYSSEFFTKNLKKFLPNMPDYKIKINWVTSNSESILDGKNTLILRLEETTDQTRNTLAATRLAIPKVVCPTIRHNINNSANAAIDLTLLKKLSDNLGKYAYPIYQKHFLFPELEEHPGAAKILAKLLSIDKMGIFVAIFLDELEKYGNYLYSKFITEDRTDELISFLSFLVKIAEREIGEEVQLNHDSSELRVAIILLAKSYKAESEGVKPYLSRINADVKLGYETIYIVSYPSARDFLTRLLKSIEAMDNIILDKRVKLEMHDTHDDEHINTGELIKLHTVKLFNNSFIEEKTAALAMKEGDRVKGTVIDVARNTSIIDVNGINCFISREECSWSYLKTCAEILVENTTYDFIIQIIDLKNNRIYLTRKFPEHSPYKSKYLPKLNDIVKATIVQKCQSYIVANYIDNIQIKIPVDEISWMPESINLNEMLDKEFDLKILEINEAADLIKGSIKLAIEDRWHILHAKYKKGTELRGIVIEKNANYVKVSMPDGLVGLIPKEAMQKGGYEYENYLQNVVVGQGLEVVISKIFIEKRKIRLDLKRNI